MDRRYDEIYDNLFRTYPPAVYAEKRQAPRDADRVLTQEIENLAKQVNLRADAKYFLKLNLLEMCIYPIAENDPRRAEEALKLAVESVHQLAGAVAGAANWLPRDGRKRVSGGQLLRLLGVMWDSLPINRIKVWDGSDDD